jgi:hypothetical protein
MSGNVSMKKKIGHIQGLFFSVQLCTTPKSRMQLHTALHNLSISMIKYRRNAGLSPCTQCTRALEAVERHILHTPPLKKDNQSSQPDAV